MNRTHQTRFFLLLVILLGAFALRVTQLEREQVSGDEAFSAEIATYPFAQQIEHLIAHTEPHPLGSFVAEKLALALFGHQEYGARYLSVMAGVLAVALMVPFMRVLLRPANATVINVTLIAAVLMALNPLAIWHSRWGRMYAISLALTLASTLLALLISQPPAASRKTQLRILTASYVAVTWLAMNMHYYAAYIIVVQNLFIVGRGLLQKQYRPKLPRWIGAQVLLGLICAPWLWVARNTLTDYVGNGTSPTFEQMLVKALSVFFVGETLPEWVTVAAWVAGALAVVGALRLLVQPRTRGAAALLLLYLCLPPLLTWLGSLSRPIFMERYLIAGLPGFVGLAAVAIVPLQVPRAAWRWVSHAVGVVAAIAIGAGTLPSLRAYYQQVAEAKPYWRTLAEAFHQYDGDLPPAQFRVAINYPDPGLSFYYPAEAQRVLLPALANDLSLTQQKLQSFVQADVRRVVFEPHPTSFDNQNVAQSALSQYFSKVYVTTTVLGQTVEIYSRLPEAELTPVGITYSNHVTLAGARVIPDVKGRFIEVHLKWLPANPSTPLTLTTNERVFVHLVRIGSSPNQVAQIDPPFTAAMLAGGVTSFGLPLPPQLEPGDYKVRIGLYDAALPNAPRIHTQDGRDAIELPIGPLK